MGFVVTLVDPFEPKIRQAEALGDPSDARFHLFIAQHEDVAPAGIGVEIKPRSASSRAVTSTPVPAGK